MYSIKMRTEKTRKFLYQNNACWLYYCFAKVFNLIRFRLKKIIRNICYYHAKSIKQDQLHLKHLYKLPVRTKNCMNTLNEALTQFSLFKEKEDNKNWVILLENVVFRPAIVTCYAPCKRSGWVFYHVRTFCTIYMPRSSCILNKRIQSL